MKNLYLTGFGLFLLSILQLVGCSSPNSSKETKPITISGTVINKNTDEPIADAIVRITDPLPEMVKVTDSTGSYKFTKQVDSTYSITIEARKEGYDIISTQVLAVPERDINIPSFKLIPNDSGNTGDTGGQTGQNRISGGAASVHLNSVSSDAIVVRESGQTETADFTFEVQDSSGRPINLAHATNVKFSIASGPGGGESIAPTTVKTDANGLATATLQSGTKAGVVKVIAQIDRKNFTIRSTPVSIAIHSGLPDAAHFGVAPDQLNFAGYNIFGLTDKITAFVGDKYGNIVSPGTVVYFTTDGGQIEGSAQTDELGRATVDLVSNNPKPNHPTLGKGFATITAKTVDENDQQISTQTTVLFSGSPVISNVSPTSVNIPNAGSQTFQYTVSDQNGNPLAPGTKISVKAEGENIKVIGDVSITMDDTQQSGAGTTDFTFNVSDAKGDSVVTKPVQITISAEGPSGKASYTISGSTHKANLKAKLN